MSRIAGIDSDNNIREIAVAKRPDGKAGPIEVVGSYDNNGTVMASPVDDNLLVTSANMKVGAYTIAAQPKGSHVVNITHTAGDTVDTLGTVVFVGIDSDGEAITETLTPVNGTIVTGVLGFETITSVTGVGWVIDAVEGTPDTIEVGVGAIVAPVGKYIYKIIVVTDTVVASEVFLSGSAGPKLVSLTALKAGDTYYGRWSKITLTSGESIAYYKVA